VGVVEALSSSLSACGDEKDPMENSLVRLKRNKEKVLSKKLYLCVCVCALTRGSKRNREETNPEGEQ